MGYDVAQWRADKAARLARGEVKPVAPVSLDPSPLPDEAFKNVAAEALAVEVPVAEQAPVAPVKPMASKPAAASWKSRRTEIGET